MLASRARAFVGILRPPSLRQRQIPNPPNHNAAVLSRLANLSWSMMLIPVICKHVKYASCSLSALFQKNKSSSFYCLCAHAQCGTSTASSVTPPPNLVPTLSFSHIVWLVWMVGRCLNRIPSQVVNVFAA